MSLASLGRRQEAVETCDQALSLRPDDPNAWLSKGIILWELEKAKEAQHAFQMAFRLREGLSDGVAGLYNVWATSTLAQGLDALIGQNSRAFEGAVRTYIDILEKAQQDGMGQIVEDALAQFKAEAEKERKHEVIEELELGIRLLSIKDPFEGWRAFTKEISKVWPEGVSAVDEISEQREHRNKWNG